MHKIQLAFHLLSCSFHFPERQRPKIVRSDALENCTFLILYLLFFIGQSSLKMTPRNPPSPLHRLFAIHRGLDVRFLFTQTQQRRLTIAV